MLNNIIFLLILLFSIDLKTADANDALETGEYKALEGDQVEGVRQITIKVLFYTVSCFCCSNVEELSITVNSNLNVGQVKAEIVREIKKINSSYNLTTNDFQLNDGKGELKETAIIGAIDFQPSLFIALK